jgi:hypothetical protein
MAWLHLKSSNLFRTKNWFKTQKEANSAQHFIVLRNKSTEVEDIEDIKSKKRLGEKVPKAWLWLPQDYTYFEYSWRRKFNI